ncbi:hypothetical protein MED297_06239 [Reinekea sp. MED297]|uniref:Uncharacterized protein n=1 Tax=Reinekea blandensis MED297 TaxID=314283 RepID=A4BDI2_9GAMM|nr:hypothetical protein MED297_06239 [Reinekea sp. MED297] [Reinekea blandensis MED297]
MSSSSPKNFGLLMHSMVLRRQDRQAAIHFDKHGEHKQIQTA